MTLRTGAYYTPLKFYGIFQTRILEWVAISYSRGPSQPRDQIANIHWIIEKTRELQENIYLCFIVGREDPLEEEMAMHSSTIAWKIPWTEKPGRVQSIGLQRVGHD